jgi:transposase
MALGHGLWAGIDVGEDSSFLSVIDAGNEVLVEQAVPTDAAIISAMLKDPSLCGIEQIALEAGASSITLVRGLRAAGHPVLVCETRQVSRYLRVRVNKTDSNDARGLAEIARLGPSDLTRVHVKSHEIQRIRSKLVFRHKLNLHRVACEGMIRSLIRLNGGSVRTAQSPVTFKRNVETALERMKIDLEVDLSHEILPLLELSLSLRTFLASLHAQLTAWASDHEVCALFMEIPGVGAICAASFYTAIEDATRFARPTDVGPYLGLTPKVLQSGKSLRHDRISKRGNKLTRSHLTLAASVILLHCPGNHLYAWGQSLVQRAGPGKARVALARKLAVLMLSMWKSGARYNPNYLTAREARLAPVEIVSEA